MPKHPRKKQKTDAGLSQTGPKKVGPSTKKQAQHQQPLGTDRITVSLEDEASKGDEERRLESMLFGTAYVPKDQENENDSDDEDLLGLGDYGKEFQGMGDADLFYIDAGEGASAAVDLTKDSDEESEKSLDSEDLEAEEPELQPSSRKQPAWTDPSDAPIHVPLAQKRQRKLRDAPDEDSLGGREYERRLRRVYEGIHGVPDWALKAKAKSTKRTRGSDDEDTEEEQEQILNSTGGILARKSKQSTVIPAGILPIERLRDANQSSASDAGEIKSIAFHPSDKVPVLCVASGDRRVRLFNIDGHTNPSLQTLHIPSLPLSHSTFHPSGNQILLTGPRPFFYTHDLQSGATTRSARGLWGTTFQGAHRANDNTGDAMEVTSFSPDGSVLAVAGRTGYVHLVDWKAGSGQVVGSLKMGTGSGVGVKALWWTGDSTSHLAAMTGDSEIFIWDVGQRACVRRWKDEGGFRGAGRVMQGSKSTPGYMAIGSTSGYVNVYDSSAFAVTPDSFLAQPKPLKSIANLTTPISTVEFNHDTQLMAIASREVKDAMRLIHLPSLTAFSNWPTSSTPLGHVTSIAFSAKSEYVAIGNTRGKVLLYGIGAYRA